MQTLHFVRQLHRIVDELKARPLSEFISKYLAKQNLNITEAEKQNFSVLIFESRVGFAELCKDEDAKKILTALEIGSVYAPQRLGKILATFTVQGQSQALWNNSDNFTEFFSFLDMLHWLVRFEKACAQLLEGEKLGGRTPEDILEVELVDYDGGGAEIDRVIQLFESLNELNTHLARILGISDAQLKVLILDSGSNLLIGVAAAASISKIIRDLFKDFWEKIKYSKFDDFDRKVESLSKGLSLTTTIHEQVEKKVIEPETGEILKVRILSEMTTLIGIGASLPATEMSETVDRKRLLAEKRGIKLLGSGDPPKV